MWLKFFLTIRASAHCPPRREPPVPDQVPSTQPVSEGRTNEDTGLKGNSDAGADRAPGKLPFRREHSFIMNYVPGRIGGK
jgi:hypothetical protein